MEQYQSSSEGMQLPYISFRHLEDALIRLAVEGPSGSLRSFKFQILPAARTQLLHAMRFLDLIAEDGQPTKVLMDLLSSVGTPKYAAALQEALRRSYPEVATVDLSSATPSMLADAFKHRARSPDRGRKALRFFLCAAQRAELPVGPRLSYGRRSPSAKPKTSEGPQARATANAFLVREMIQKVPDFDPSWPPAVQVNWLKAVRVLAERI
jgi:hypothetical protein